MNNKYFLLTIFILTLIFFVGCDNYSSSDTPIIDSQSENNQINKEYTEERYISESNNDEKTPLNVIENNINIEYKMDSGRYYGITNNILKVKISGIPEEQPAKEFIIYDEIIKKIEEFNIEIEDNIKFEYYINNENQSIIVELTKIVN